MEMMTKFSTDEFGEIYVIAKYLPS